MHAWDAGRFWVCRCGAVGRPAGVARESEGHVARSVAGAGRKEGEKDRACGQVRAAGLASVDAMLRGGASPLSGRQMGTS